MDSIETRLFGKDIDFKADVVLRDGKLYYIEGVGNLFQAIRSLLFTSPGDIVHEPSYGVGLRDFVNATNSLENQRKIANRIKEGLESDDRVKAVDSVSIENLGGGIVRIILKIVPNTGEERIIFDEEYSL